MGPMTRKALEQSGVLEKPRYFVQFTPVGWWLGDRATGDEVHLYGTGREWYRHAKAEADRLNSENERLLEKDRASGESATLLEQASVAAPCEPLLAAASSSASSVGPSEGLSPEPSRPPTWRLGSPFCR